jgi:hypothetical protein
MSRELGRETEDRNEIAGVWGSLDTPKSRFNEYCLAWGSKIEMRHLHVLFVSEPMSVSDHMPAKVMLG